MMHIRLKTLFHLLTLCSLSFARIIHVPADVSTIQTGIKKAANGDTVLVQPGGYRENINFKGKAITVASLFIFDQNSNTISNTVIDGSQPGHPDSGSVVFFISGEDSFSILCGFTVMGGIGTKIERKPGVFVRAGGGILLLDAAARIENNFIINNYTYDPVTARGGGICVYNESTSAPVILEDNLISTNTVEAMERAWSGGVDIYGNVYLLGNEISDNFCTAYLNRAGGGGIGCFSATGSRHQVVMRGNQVLRNRAEMAAVVPFDTLQTEAWGGGILSIACDLKMTTNHIEENILMANWFCRGAGIDLREAGSNTTINRNLFRLNTTNGGNGQGGAIRIIGGAPVLTNNLIIENNADRGGGLYIHEKCSAHFINNTIVHNTARVLGGAVYCNNSNAAFVNCILWANTDMFDQEIIVINGTVEIAYSNVRDGWEGEGNIDSEPLFQPSFDEPYRLSESSPCVDNGAKEVQLGETRLVCPLDDYAGNNRPNANSLPDMGAYESDVTGSSLKPDITVSAFELAQNYPNPFNPSTNIEYSLLQRDHVQIKVYNSLGQTIKTLIDQIMPAGRHQIIFEANNLPSGTYFYRIQVLDPAGRTSDFQDVRKMVIVR